MATILKIKRSATNPTATPSALGQGELAYGEGTSNYTDAQSASVTSYGKLFIGRGTENSGEAANIDIVGGKFFTDLLDHGHGTLTANSAAIVDSASKVNVWNVDNITLDGNTISTTNNNGDLTFNTNGNGDVIVSGTTTVGNNLFKISDGSTDRFVVDSFSGAIDITTPALSAADTVLNIASTWNNGSNKFDAIKVNVTNTASAGTSLLMDLQVGGASQFKVELDGTVSLGGDFAVNGGDITTTAATFNLLEANATTVNAFGAATAIDIGATSGTATINNPTVVGTQTTQNLWNATATTVNAFGAATTINMGTNATTLDLGYIRINGNTISTDSSSATELVIDPFPDAGDAGGDVIIRGNLQVAGTTTTVNSTEMSVNDPVFTIGDTVTEKTVTAVAASGQTAVVVDNPSGVVEGATITGTGIAGGSTVSNVRIEFHITGTPFSTAPSAGDDIYFYDGTSFSLLGDYVSKTGSSVTIDLAANISTRGDDFYNGNSLTSASSGSPSAAVSASITKVNTKVFKTTTLTLSANTTSSVAAETKLTISQASDDNLDRGIQFKYLTGNASKAGFFGYDDSTGYFTFIPDASNNSNLFGGTVGEAWFKTVKLDDGVNKGVPYFDSDKELHSTVAAGTSDITTSHKILTSNGATGEPIWTSTLDGGTY